MELSKKLQIPKGTRVFVVDTPKGLKLDLDTAKHADSTSAILVFARDFRALKENSKEAIKAAKEDRIAWIAYPKAGQLGTDINRDSLNSSMEAQGIGGVRMVSIDEVWAAMRFRPSSR